jgi:hypothetical protein
MFLISDWTAINLREMEDNTWTLEIEYEGIKSIDILHRQTCECTDHTVNCDIISDHATRKIQTYNELIRTIYPLRSGFVSN